MSSDDYEGIERIADELKTMICETVNVPLNHPEYGKNHMLDMCNDIIHGRVTGEKAHRYIGWIQGCLCVMHVATLEDFKDMNRDRV